MKYKVVVGTLFVDGIKYRRGDIIETDQDFGTRVEPYVEPKVEEKPKRKRRTKAEIEAEKMLEELPSIGGEA
jgi:signal peptidase I